MTRQEEIFKRKLRTLSRIDLSSVIIAVDFDGTCVMHEFPEIGEDVPGAVSVLKALNAAGAKLIVWTVRSDQEEIANDPNADIRVAQAAERRTVEYLKHACAWFDARAIKLYAANCNHQQKEWSSSPKAYAHLYIDDAALGCPLVHEQHERPYVDWDEVCSLLIKRFL